MTVKNKVYKFQVGEEIHIGNFHGTILELTTNKEGRKAYKYRCLKCGYEDGEKVETLIEKGFGCPCCANRIIVPGINDIPTTDSWMIPYFQGGEEEASLYSKSCGKEIVPKCPDCGRLVTKQTVNSIYTHKGISCVCKDGISFPNKIVYFIMEQLFNHQLIHCFKREYYVQSEDKFYDMYFETNNHEKFFVEMDGGIGHGFVIRNHDKFKSNKPKFYPSSMFKNDIIKEKIAQSLGINLIRIDCYYSDFEYIKNNIINSELINIVDLTQIDWAEVEKQSYSNLMKIICQYKKDNTDVFVKDAIKKFHVSSETIRKYWSLGNDLGWCVFDRKSEDVRSRKARTYFGQSCPVIIENVKTLEKITFDSVIDFVNRNSEYFVVPFTRKVITNKFKKCNNFIENYEGYNIYKLQKNCDRNHEKIREEKEII